MDDDPRIPMAGTLAKLVGAMVIYYAMLEHWIDGMVFCIHDCVDGARNVRKQHPYNAKDEIDFLRRSFETLPQLAQYKNEGLALLSQIEKAADLRHNIVHGHIRKMQWNSGTMEFSRKFKGDKGQPVRRTLTIQAEELFARGREVLALVQPTMDLTHRLIAKFDPAYKLEAAKGILGWSLSDVVPVVMKIND